MTNYLPDATSRRIVGMFLRTSNQATSKSREMHCMPGHGVHQPHRRAESRKVGVLILLGLYDIGDSQCFPA